jgi:hypothetical protein
VAAIASALALAGAGDAGAQDLEDPTPNPFTCCEAYPAGICKIRPKLKIDGQVVVSPVVRCESVEDCPPAGAFQACNLTPCAKLGSCSDPRNRPPHVYSSTGEAPFSDFTTTSLEVEGDTIPLYIATGLTPTPTGQTPCTPSTTEGDAYCGFQIVLELEGSGEITDFTQPEGGPFRPENTTVTLGPDTRPGAPDDRARILTLVSTNVSQPVNAPPLTGYEFLGELSLSVDAEPSEPLTLFVRNPESRFVRHGNTDPGEDRAFELESFAQTVRTEADQRVIVRYVPEPERYLLLGSALAGLAALHWLRERRR